jgi:GGDEF domain-containing protein
MAMTITEIALWSACIGVFALCMVVSLLNALTTRTLAGLQFAAFVALAGFFVATGSGLVSTLLVIPSGLYRTLLLILGPMSGCAGALGLMFFLRSHHNDTLVQRGLMAVATVCAALVLSVLWPVYVQALEFVAIGTTLCAFASFWLALRSALQGDRFAWPMAAACVAMVIAVMGIYGLALRAIDQNLFLQALSAIAATGYLTGCVIALWLRNTEYLRMRRALLMHREKDLLTQLWTGAALIRLVEQTITRARRNRQETAILCIELFNSQELRLEMGSNAIEQVVYSIAARIRQSVGSSKEVGRYDDNSFVVVIENIKRPAILRTIGLRLAAATRKPYMLNPYSTSPREFRADIGIGIARLPASRDPRAARFGFGLSTKSGRVSKPSPADTSFNFDSMGVAQEAMHDASELAKKSLGFSSRTAIIDAYSRKPLPVEQADLR